MDLTERGHGGATPSQLNRLLGLADAAAPARTAVVHPVDALSLIHI